jgi:hypothetical protein
LITFVKGRLGHDRRYAMDTRKIERELHWRPKETFETGIRKTVNWCLQHADWVQGHQRWLPPVDRKTILGSTVSGLNKFGLNEGKTPHDHFIATKL